jgi:hypothetical protein
MILIGSRALALRCPSALTRPPRDFDWVCTQVEYEQWMDKNADKIQPTKVYALPEFNKQIVEGSTNLEFEIITPGHSTELLAELVHGDKDSIDTPFGKIPSLDMLYTIKDAHRFKKFNYDQSVFWKTAIDYHMMKSAGAVIRPEYAAFHKMRETESYAAQKHPKLNTSKENFFKDDGITYVHDHDDLHLSVKLYDRPAYTYYLKDNEPVLCDKQKFFAVSEDIRLAGGCEEAMTLAIERSLVPSPGVWTPDFAMRFALGKICSSITSGFFRRYCHDHIFDIIKLYEQTSKGYWDKFQQDVKDGKVRPFNSTTSAYGATA